MATTEDTKTTTTTTTTTTTVVEHRVTTPIHPFFSPESYACKRKGI